MFKNIASLKFTVNGREHIYLVEHETTTDEVKEFAYQLIKYVGQIDDAQKALKEQQEAASEAPPEEPKPE